LSPGTGSNLQAGERFKSYLQKNMKVLSIISICLNNKYGLETTLKSIENQQFRNFELIVIDGGSVDGSCDVIDKYKYLIDFSVSEKDNGIYNAMNKGLNHASGKFCLFLNSGDYLLNSMVLKEVFDEDPEADIIYGNLVVRKGRRRFKLVRYPPSISLSSFLKDALPLHQQASFIKRELFLRCGQLREDFKIISDWEFFFRSIIKFRCSTKHIDKFITIFNDQGVSSKKQSGEEHLKMKILQETFPNELLFKPKTFYQVNQENVKNKVKRKLGTNKVLFKLLHLFYKPFTIVNEYLNYRRLK
jgi:glycosyltransferase involved in cell wall biosynthesis